MSQTQIILSAVATAAAAALSAGRASGQTFIGQNFGASQYLNDSTFRPPDSNGAVGVDHYVELINGRYSVFRKSDAVRVQSRTLFDFWTAAGVTPLPTNVVLPRILYDQHAQRWYAAAIDGLPNPTGNNFLFAVSNTSDPTAGWRGFAIDSDADNNVWADFPMMGYNKDVVVLAGNMFLTTPPSTGQSSTFVVIPKNDLLGATPTVANATKFEELSTAGGPGFSVQPAVDLDNGSLPLPLLSSFTLSNLKRSRVTGTPTSPSISFPVTGLIPIGTNAVAPNADQPGPKADIETNIGTLNPRFIQNPVLNNGELWAVHSVNVGDRAGLRWYRINDATNTLIESGFISHPSLAYFEPSIAVNDFGDVVIGFSGTDPGTFASAFAVVGKTTGGVTTFGTPFITKAGVSDYELLDGQGRNRWGDYSSTTNDPADPSIFWTIQEYVHATDVWGTQVTEIILPQPGEVRWKDPTSGSYSADANWFGGAAPTPAGHVIFSRATSPGGPGYTVSFAADQALDRLSVRQGKVTLALDGHTISASNTGTRSLSIAEFGGTPALTIDDGRLDLAGPVFVGAGGRLTLANGGDTVVRAAALTGAGTTDLNDNGLLATASSYAALATLVAQGRNGGAWDAPGLTSTAARTHPQHATTLGVLSGADYLAVNGTDFHGFTVAPADTVVRYTWYGDSDLNGVVDFDDYVRTDGGFNAGLGDWANGDFDYNGAVDFDDYVLIDLAFNAQNGSLLRAVNWLSGDDRSFDMRGTPGTRKVFEHYQQFGLAYAAGFLAAVPEPASVAGIVSCAGMLIARRRFRR